MDNRKRVNSSMSYDEYVGVFERPPKAPHFKPLDGPVDIPELSLDNDNSPTVIEAYTRLDPMKISDRIDHFYRPKNVIMEEICEEFTPNLVYEMETIQIFDGSSKKKGRQRSQSENIQYTFMSAMQKGIQRKESIKQET